MRLEAAELSFGYASRTVGVGVNLTVGEGEVLALLGPNGAGKTTLFKTLLGLLPPKSGNIFLNCVVLSGLSRVERARLIGYVPQAHAALFPFSVEEVVLMGRAARVSPFAMPADQDRAVAAMMLDRLGVGHLNQRTYTEISGGERQMVLIARALAQEPKLIVMDEPTASLDYGNQMRVLSQIRRLAAEGMSVILSTHNPDHVFMVADRVALLHEGELAALGLPSKVLTADWMKKLYDVDIVIGTLPGSETLVCAPRINLTGGT